MNLGASFFTILIAVGAEVAGHYICKQLDSNHNDNQHIEKPGAGTPGFSFACIHDA